MHSEVKTEADVRAVYEAIGFNLASRNDLIEKWCANSQYGYTFEWFDTKQEAEAYSIEFYLKRGWM